MAWIMKSIVYAFGDASSDFERHCLPAVMIYHHDKSDFLFILPDCFPVCFVLFFLH